jgi:hypothetical protein
MHQRMDEAGFEAIEIIATTNFKKQIRDLKKIRESTFASSRKK